VSPVNATRLKQLRHLIGGTGDPLAALPPRFSPLLQPVLRLVGPVYRRLGMGIRHLTVTGREAAVQAVAGPAVTGTEAAAGSAVRQVHAPPVKVFFAFRHPSVDDPPIVYHVVQQLLHQTRRRGASARGRAAQHDPDSRRGSTVAKAPIVLYGRDVPVWAGPLAAWILPRIGAISVFHEQVKRDSLDEVYAAVRKSAQPIVLAPEAQVTYHNYRVAPTQRGTAHLAVEAARARAGTPGAVEVIPIGLEYRYPDRGNRQLHRLLRKVSAELDLPYRKSGDDPVGHVWELYAHLFYVLETRYGVAPEPEASTRAADPARNTELAGRFNNRLHRLIHAILATGERDAGISATPGSTPISRVFQLRRIFWERRFPPCGSSPFEKRLLDIAAMEACVTARHFQTVDLLAYLDFTYLAEAGLLPGTPIPPAGSAALARLVEYLVSLDDALSRAQGHTIARRHRWRGRRCAVRFGDAIPVAAPAERSHRHTYIAELQQRIQTALIEISAVEG
jgi:hypothetical protein